MLLATAVELQSAIATRFGFTDEDPLTETPRDVLWARDGNAYRFREEQSRRLERATDLMMPFMSFYRTSVRAQRSRMNLPLAKRGAIYEVAADGKSTKVYKMVPVEMIFQIEFWSDQPIPWETAQETWLKWAMPPNELTLTDLNGAVFSLPMVFGDPIDNSLIEQQFDIGPQYRETFPLSVMGWVITEPDDAFKTILTERVRFWEYAQAIEDAVLIKSVVQT